MWEQFLEGNLTNIVITQNCIFKGMMNTYFLNINNNHSIYPNKSQLLVFPCIK